MKHSDSLAQLAPALVAAQAELRSVTKDATNPHFKNRYASLDAIIEEVRPVLAKHGLAVVHGGESDLGPPWLRVSTMLVHTSGEWLCGGVDLPIPKLDPQGAGAAMTYGRRFGLSALLSLATDEDDDGNAASRPRAAKQSKPSDGRPHIGGAVADQSVATASARPEDRKVSGKRLGDYTVAELGKIYRNAEAANRSDVAEAAAAVLEAKRLENDEKAKKVLGMDDDSTVNRAVAAEEKFQKALPF